ncbi:MAG: fumarylacetoacetate hydrolase family protein [Chloroflexi bacterium]|nr:fumarylacetoacetate hydrolase family protein [Chloroflexota bacterium]
MKLVTFTDNAVHIDPHANRQDTGTGGVLHNGRVYKLSALAQWAQQNNHLTFQNVPSSVLDFVNLTVVERETLAEQSHKLEEAGISSVGLEEVRLRAPIELPPSVRDFYAFEQHVKTARANRGLGMIPEWYDFPVFYFSNHRAIYGPEDEIPYPRESKALDFELEMACVIGRAGRDIPAQQGSLYIAGYCVMNDWSARDLQMEEMKLNMGPVKGKDFATSLGPWLVTPDELSGQLTEQGAAERYDLAMTARLNGKEISRGNFKDIYFSFPQMIERASMNTWLVPGDIIGSGTVGTGCLLEFGDKRERYLQPGDVMELEIEGLGVLRNTVIESN